MPYATVLQFLLGARSGRGSHALRRIVIGSAAVGSRRMGGSAPSSDPSTHLVRLLPSPESTACSLRVTPNACTPP